jgi:hypothetical protein
MTIAPFTSTQDLLSFARKFLDDRVEPFRADVAICLTPDVNGHRAEFPALITCIGFLELLTSLYAGSLKVNGLAKLQNYATKFMDAANYDSLRLKVLYVVFRHKLAHLSFLHFVFDTKDQREFKGEKRMRITWTVDHEMQPVPINLIGYPKDKFLRRAVTPWSMSYNCRAEISVPKLQNDVIDSLFGQTGYFQLLKTDAGIQENFAKCIKVMFPP